MNVKHLIHILSLMDPESKVFIRLTGNWDGIGDYGVFNLIEFTGSEIRVEDTENKVVTIYANLEEINQI